MKRFLSALIGLAFLALPASAQQIGISGSTSTISACLNDYTSNSSAYTTTSSTVRQLGYGAGGWTCTPTSSKILVQVNLAVVDTNVSGQNLILRLRYGTGSIPAANAAETGTVCGRNYTGGQIINYGHSALFPISLSCYVTGLTPGVAVWFDPVLNSPDNTSSVISVQPAINVFNIP